MRRDDAVTCRMRTTLQFAQPPGEATEALQSHTFGNAILLRRIWKVTNVYYYIGCFYCYMLLLS